MGIVWIGIFSVRVCRGGRLPGVWVDDTELNYGWRVNGTTVGWQRGVRGMDLRNQGEAYRRRRTCGPAWAPA